MLQTQRVIRFVAALMLDLGAASCHTFKCASFFPAERNANEFFAALQMCADPAEAAASRQLLHQTIGALLGAQAREPSEAHALRAQEVQAAHAARQALENALTSSRADLARVENALVQVRASSSRRITAPLRSLMAWVRKARI